MRLIAYYIKNGKNLQNIVVRINYMRYGNIIISEITGHAMTKTDLTKRENEHRIEVLKALNDYLTESKALFEAHGLNESLSGVPEGLARDRSNLMEILLDDLETILAAIYHKDPSQAPLSLYQRIINLRNPHDKITPEDAQIKLQAAVDKFIAEGSRVEPPEFLKVLRTQLPLDDIEDQPEAEAARLTQLMHEIMSYNQPDSLLAQAEVAETIANVTSDFVHEEWADSPDGAPKERHTPRKSRNTGMRDRFYEIRPFLTEEVVEKFEVELDAAESGSSGDAEKSSDWLRFALSLPWTKSNADQKSVALTPEEQVTQITAMKAALDENHAGDTKLKRSLLEFMATQLQSGKSNGKIICLVGPPGVGKTSLGKSIAKATGREFASISLGGEKDAATLKGDRSVFVGASPGRILKSIKRFGTTKMVIMLDEIGRLAHKNGEDPEAVLLEILDPSQNKEFQDSYLDVSFDLSDIIFMGTANDISHMSQAVQDRMHIIHHDGYIPEEKLAIARNHLIPKLQRQLNLTPDDIILTDDALEKLMNEYTREAGVRSLERRLEGIFSKVILERLENGHSNFVKITADNLDVYCDPSHQVRREIIPPEDRVGRFNALAASDTGGLILSKQAERLPSQDGFKLAAPTGLLGEMANETVNVASTWVRKNAINLGISPWLLEKTELRIHSDSWSGVEGPSAGGVMTTLIVSVMTGIPTKRDVAMTGTINYDGKIGKIGGLKQKLDGARTAGVKTVLISRENEIDLRDIPQSLQDDLNIIVVDTMDDVLKHALTKQPKPLDMSLYGRTTRTFQHVSQRLLGESSPRKTQSHITRPSI